MCENRVNRGRAYATFWVSVTQYGHFQGKVSISSPKCVYTFSQSSTCNSRACHVGMLTVFALYFLCIYGTPSIARSHPVPRKIKGVYDMRYSVWFHSERDVGVPKAPLTKTTCRVNEVARWRFAKRGPFTLLLCRSLFLQTLYSQRCLSVA